MPTEPQESVYLSGGPMAGQVIQVKPDASWIRIPRQRKPTKAQDLGDIRENKSFYDYMVYNRTVDGFIGGFRIYEYQGDSDDNC